MKRALVALLVGALTLSIVAPALGGPNPLRIAKKALRVATGTKQALKRSYLRTHPTEVVTVDGGERTAQPFDFASWDIKCPDNFVVAGTNIGYGALEPVSDLSYGTGVLVSLFNPSDTTPFSGDASVNCVWGLGSDQIATASRSRHAAVAAQRQAQLQALQGAR